MSSAGTPGAALARGASLDDVDPINDSAEEIVNKLIASGDLEIPEETPSWVPEGGYTAELTKKYNADLFHIGLSPQESRRRARQDWHRAVQRRPELRYIAGHVSRREADAVRRAAGLPTERRRPVARTRASRGFRRTVAPTRGSPDDEPHGEPAPAGLAAESPPRQKPRVAQLALDEGLDREMGLRHIVPAVDAELIQLQRRVRLRSGLLAQWFKGEYGRLSPAKQLDAYLALDPDVQDAIDLERKRVLDEFNEQDRLAIDGGAR